MIVHFEHGGEPVTLEGFDGDHISKVIERTRNFYEPEMLGYIGELKPAGTILDVGSYIGNHAVYFGMFTDANKVIAVEPNPSAHGLLTRNIRANCLGSVVVPIECAAGESPGRVGIRQGRVSNLGHTVVTTGEEVELRTLDGIAGDEEVSVLKIDVEGYVTEVLKGAAQLMASQHPTIFVEALTLRRKRRLDKLLSQFDYKPGPVFRNGAPMYTYAK